MEQYAELKSIPEIQEIAAYLRNMKFKRKVFGGCDPESVLNHMYQVTAQYETIIASLLSQRGNARQVSELQARLAQAERDNAMVRWYEESVRASLWR